MVMTPVELVYGILLAPLVGLALNTITYRGFPDRFAGIVATLAVTVSAGFSWLLWFGYQDPVSWTLYTWIDTSMISVSVGFLVDQLTLLMLLVVTTVSACVHLYSIEYMEHDEGAGRFFIYLNLFVFAMLVLVLADNLLMMFIGWEGVGLCSYLLIGFWYDRESARWAGQKAFVVNRLGDFSFLVGLLVVLAQFGTFSFAGLEATVADAPHRIITAVGLLLFGGAVGKSAQFPLYVWLPDAMEGPTPVSSLIHAATMVTAGVYLVARMGFLYTLVEPVGTLIAILGAITALFAASIALVHRDMKRILAYSTVSQLGYMFVGVGLGAYGAGIFHLMTHAFFKGLLFLMAGSVMHALHGELNIFKMDRLAGDMPLTLVMAVIGGLGLSGFPYLAGGFYSKDEILLATLRHTGPVNWFLFGALSLGALFTAFYTFRMITVAFFTPSSDRDSLPDSVHECGWVMGLPMAILAVGTLGGGWFANWITEFGHHGGHHGPHTLVVGVSIAASLLGIGAAILIYYNDWGDLVERGGEEGTLATVLREQYYVETAYRAVIVRPLRKLGRFSWRILDDLVIDGLANLSAALVDMSGLVLRFTQTGLLRHYLFLLTLAITTILTLVGFLVIGL